MATKEIIKQNILSNLKGFLKSDVGITFRNNKGQRAILDAIDALTPKNEPKDRNWDSGSIFTLFRSRQVQNRDYSSKALEKLATAASENPNLAKKINNIIQSKATDRDLEDVRNTYKKINTSQVKAQEQPKVTKPEAAKPSTTQAKISKPASSASASLDDRIVQATQSYAQQSITTNQNVGASPVTQTQSIQGQSTKSTTVVVAFENDKKKEEKKHESEFDSIKTRARAKAETEEVPPPPPNRPSIS